jgi:hypothetical protein
MESGQASASTDLGREEVRVDIEKNHQ